MIFIVPMNVLIKIYCMYKRVCVCVCVCVCGIVVGGGVSKVKPINLVFISWHCLYLPCSHSPTKRHKRANSYPATLQTAPQAQCTRPAECRALIKRQSQGSSQVSLQCLPTAPPDLSSQLSLLITCVWPVAALKPRFVQRCLACQLASSSQK